MRTNIFTLLFILSYSGVVFSECSGGFDFDCIYDAFFGDEESSEEESLEKIQSTLNGKDLSSVIRNADERFEEIPKIVFYLKNLTRTVAHVQRELIGDKLNEIKEELSNESQLTKEVSNSSPESSQEKNGKKIELSKTIGKEMASKLSEIPRLSSDVSKLSQMVKSLIDTIAKNKTALAESKNEASKNSGTTADKPPASVEKAQSDEAKSDEKTDETKSGEQ